MPLWNILGFINSRNKTELSTQVRSFDSKDQIPKQASDTIEEVDCSGQPEGRRGVFCCRAFKGEFLDHNLSFFLNLWKRVNLHSRLFSRNKIGSKL